MQYRQRFKYPLENSGSDLEDMEEEDPEAYNVFAELLRANVDEAVSDSDTDFDYVPEDGPPDTDESFGETTDDERNQVQQNNTDNNATAAEEVITITDSKASEESSSSYFTGDNNEAAGTSAGKSQKTTNDDSKATADSSDDSNFTSDMDAPSGSTKHAGERAAVYDMDEDDEDDETVRAIIAAIKKPRSAPAEIKMEEHITDICFHPERDIVALATITGDVALYQYGTESNVLLHNVEVHAKACRDVEFSEDGRYLLTCSKDKSIMITDMETEKLKKFYESAHLEAINKLYVLDENLFFSGDDGGMVKLWDLRTRHAVFALKEVEDYVTQMITNDAKKLLLVTSGDGYLTTINIGARKLYVQSEPYEDELNCMGIYRGDSKLVVGTGKGHLYTYNWGQFGYHCDMYPGVKSPINQMIPITDRIGCVAGEEGIIRAVHIAPYRNLGIVGQHSLPIECLDINHSGELIASSAHDNDVRFWNIKYFEDFADIKYNEKHNNFKEKRHNLPSSKFSNASDFFSDLAKESSDNE